MLTWTDRYHVTLIFFRITERIYTRNGRNYYNVTAFEQCAGCGVAKLVYFIIYRCVFFNINVLAGYICLRLIIIVIRNKVFDRIFGKQRFEFRAKLCRKRFIVGKYKCGLVYVCDYVRHREGFAGAGHAHERLFRISAQHSFGKSLYRFGLIACRFEF